MGKNQETSVTKKQQKMEKVINNSIKKLTKDSQEIKDLMDTFVQIYNCDDEKYLFELNEKNAKLYMAYTRAHHVQNTSCSKIKELIYDSHTCGDLGTEVDSYLSNTGLVVNDVLKETLRYRTANIVNKSEFNQKMKELFGENVEYSYEDIKIRMGCNIVHYDPSIESYVEYSGYECGGTCNGVTTTLKDIKQNGKNLSLIVDVKQEENRTLKYNFKLENDHYVFVNIG